MIQRLFIQEEKTNNDDVDGRTFFWYIGAIYRINEVMHPCYFMHPYRSRHNLHHDAVTRGYTRITLEVDLNLPKIRDPKA